MNESNHNYPPPWDLLGEGFILPFWAKSENLYGWIAQEDQASYRGGLGAIMFVNYQKSNVGPYYELLLIPGDFVHRSGTYKKITKIFVSSQISVREGIRNWAIPKEMAEFRWEKKGDFHWIEVKNEQGTLSVGLERFFIPFPVTTSLTPFTLLQRATDTFLKTKFVGNGMGKLTSLDKWENTGNLFPNIFEIAKYRLPIVGISPFSLVFPTAQREAL
jgi:hypothetical protein